MFKLMIRLMLLHSQSVSFWAVSALQLVNRVDVYTTPLLVGLF